MAGYIHVRPVFHQPKAPDGRPLPVKWVGGKTKWDFPPESVFQYCKTLEPIPYPDLMKKDKDASLDP